MAVAAAALPLGAPRATAERASASGAAVVAGNDVPLRSALAWRDGFGDLTLLLTPNGASCASISEPRRGPYVWVWLHRAGSGPARVVVTFAPRSGRPIAVRSRVGFVIARGTWNGELRVSSRAIDGKRFAATVRFTALWCGRR